MVDANNFSWMVSALFLMTCTVCIVLGSDRIREAANQDHLSQEAYCYLLLHAHWRQERVRRRGVCLSLNLSLIDYR